MKVGDEVTVYEDPLTQKRKEGKAKLVKLLMNDIQMQYWRVTFTENAHGHRCQDDTQYNRWLKKR